MRKPKRALLRLSSWSSLYLPKSIVEGRLDGFIFRADDKHGFAIVMEVGERDIVPQDSYIEQLKNIFKDN
jgi:uncharacterized membrane protein